jgi:hypothetical protein
VPDRPDVHVRLVPLKLLLCHFVSPVVSGQGSVVSLGASATPRLTTDD